MPSLLRQPGEVFALLDDPSDKAGGGARLLYDVVEVLECRDGREAEDALQAVERASGEGRWSVIAADYELGYLLEPKLRQLAPPCGRPLLTAYLFESMALLDRAATERFIGDMLAALPPQARIAGVAGLRCNIEKPGFLAAVERIRRYIAAGDCYQVNFTYALDFDHYGAPLALYAKLRRRQPVRYGAFVQGKGQAILSLSPELFVERTGERLTSRPMKGTAPRGRTPQEDAAHAATLAASAKDRAENVMIVDLIRNDLGRLGPPGSVHVERLFEVEAYPTVFQMVSTVTATLPRRPLVDIFRALFPCGSITGAPKIRAMQIIRELEREARGLYTGALGYVAPDGDFTFNVAIRTLVLDAEGRGRIGLGSGIVYDSDPAKEFEECRWKGQFLTDLDADFQLIESLRLDPACPSPFPYLDDHLRRLDASALYFGFRCDLDSIRQQLLVHAQGLGAAQPCKTRLLLSKDGECRIESSPVPAAVGSELPTVVLSAQRVDSRDPLLYHKTTARLLYDAELARIGEIPGCFDVLFCNERGELCEGARSNLFVDIGGVLHTPPLSAGLLNGVMRQRVLARQDPPAREATLYPRDLLRADAIYVSNAVRGLQRVASRGDPIPSGVAQDAATAD